MKTFQKLPFQPVGDRPSVTRREWEEIARVINFNAERLLLVGTDAEMTAIALQPEELREDQIWYNKTDGLLYRWDGSAWVQP